MAAEGNKLETRRWRVAEEEEEEGKGGANGEIGKGNGRNDRGEKRVGASGFLKQRGEGRAGARRVG